MAKILMIGLTSSGQSSQVNEDAFLFKGGIFPDLISGREEQSGSSDAYEQLYLVCEGFGGAGAGDIAARLVHRIALRYFERRNEYHLPQFDFAKFSRDFIAEAHAAILKRLTNKFRHPVGCSFCLVYIEANQVHFLNLGRTMIHLYRNKEIYRLNHNENKSALPIKALGYPATEEPPQADGINTQTLRPGDIYLLSSSGINQNFSGRELAKILSYPDAFAANIRQIMIDGTKKRPDFNRTIFALKVSSLEISLPSGPSPKEIKRQQRYYIEGTPDTDNPAKIKAKAKKMRAKKLKQKGRAATFFRYLLFGLITGIVILSIIWHFLL